MPDKSIIDSPNTLARIASVLFLMVVMLGITLELFVLPGILVPGDAAATINNLNTFAALFRATVFGYLVRQVLLALLALVTYKLFKPVDKNAAGLMVILALLSTPINMFNDLNYFAALQLAAGADDLTALGTDQLQALVMFFLKMHEYGANIPAILSLWISLLGYLASKSRFVPRILGIWMMVGGIIYSIQAALLYLFPTFDATSFGLFAFAGEALFYLWFLIRGVKMTQGEQTK